MENKEGNPGIDSRRRLSPVWVLQEEEWCKGTFGLFPDFSTVLLIPTKSE